MKSFDTCDLFYPRGVSQKVFANKLVQTEGSGSEGLDRSRLIWINFCTQSINLGFFENYSRWYFSLNTFLLSWFRLSIRIFWSHQRMQWIRRGLERHTKNSSFYSMLKSFLSKELPKLWCLETVCMERWCMWEVE